ncbi:AI-2E family transporter [Geodermatophilus normandii]|uniref:AI-2E family transporter n=1 Tax=Geodermatophilus normandii TaxID=1137989 RepID=A0A6P0GDY4_9ACTN|nr:AI-2E family transporter [Geodermatophilus normandii]NEM04679.1 AI-2E family transporter [Geodermatophilus normandii]
MRFRLPGRRDDVPAGGGAPAAPRVPAGSSAAAGPRTAAHAGSGPPPGADAGPAPTLTGEGGAGDPRAADHDATVAPAAGWRRGERAVAAARVLAIGSAQLLLIAAALVVVGWILGKLWVILLPIVLGLLFATVLWPPTRFLRRHGWPPALAAALVLLLFLGLIAGLIAVIAPQVASQVTDLADQFTGGLEQVQQWLQGPPFNVDEEQIGQVVDQAIDSVQANASNIAGYAATGASAVGSGLINLVLALLLAFFFIKDGPRWVPWLAAQTGPKAAPHVAALSQKTWSTLSEFIKQQALVGFVDAFFIGLGLWILDVPLVIPLAVLTFFGAFIPIIGAFVAGAFAVLIALVDEGFTVALIVFGIVLLVQQIEGNVLQPIIQGRGFNLHAAVVILAVTAGSSLFGIIGAFLGVPVAALTAVIYRYTRDVFDGRHPEVAGDGRHTQVTGDDDGAVLTRVPGTPG